MNHDQQQPPYPPQPHRRPLTLREPASYQHQLYSGSPQPGWQGQPPQKEKRRTAWIVGGIALAVVLACILGFTACTALVQSINGGGGSQEEKATAMTARADKVPEEDWVEVYRENPTVDPGCLSIDTSCLRLTAKWTVNHKVSLDEVAGRFGMKSGKAGPLSGRYMGCVKKEFDGTSEESLCIDESAEGSDSYEVTIQMQRD
jgi:hypothetical protein